MIQLVGGFAVGLAGGVWRQMTPSLPLGWFQQPELETPAPRDFTWFGKHRFAVIFGVVLAGKLAVRLGRRSRSEPARAAAAGLERVTGRFAGEWISLIVVNAFIAFGAVLAIQFTRQFTWTAWVWQLLGELLRPVGQAVASLLPGGLVDMAHGWVAWYGANQLKFMFWLLYSAAICDDLGLPNYKTLWRRLWRRWGVGKAKVASAG